MENFTKMEAAEIIDLAPRQIQYFTEHGIVEPEADPGEGRGKIRRYSKKNLIEFGIVRELSKYKISLITISEIFNILRVKLPNRSILDDWEKIKSDSFIVLYRQNDGKFKHEVSINLSDPNLIFDVYKLKKASSVFVVNLAMIVKVLKKL